MLTEALVVAACLNQKGCSDTTDAYYKSSPDLQTISKNLEHMGKSMVNNNEWIIFAVSPIYMIASHQTAKFKITRYFFITVSTDSEGAGFEWKF